jgi:hypothetical protein
VFSVSYSQHSRLSDQTALHLTCISTPRVSSARADSPSQFGTHDAGESVQKGFCFSFRTSGLSSKHIARSSNIAVPDSDDCRLPRLSAKLQR